MHGHAHILGAAHQFGGQILNSTPVGVFGGNDGVAVLLLGFALGRFFQLQKLGVVFQIGTARLIVAHGRQEGIDIKKGHGVNR